MRRILLPLLLLLPIVGCALTSEEIEVRHGSPAALASLPGAAAVGVSVVAQDARPSNRDRVSAKKNGYGMEMAPIIARNEVVAETREGVEAALRQRGFAIGGQDARIELEVQRFWNDFKVGFWSGDAVAEISVQLRLLDRAGQIAFTHTYNAEFRNAPVYIFTGENARIALEGALRQLVQRIAEDPTLARALLATAPPPPPARRRGAGA